MKVLIAYIFSLTIIVFSALPTIAFAADIDFDISLVLDCNEEEESTKDFKLKILQDSHIHSFSFEEEIDIEQEIYRNDYVSELQDLTSPPPEYA